MAIVASHDHPVRATPDKLPRWQEVMKAAIRDPRELCRRLGLSGEFEQSAIRAAENFPLFAPAGFIERIEPGNPNDPLLRQILPVQQELDQQPDFVEDPVADLASETRPGILHKYPGRALLITTGACAIHCRYCFRRHFPYHDAPQSIEAWRPAIEYIADDDSITEVILSGGDPLTLVDSQLQRLVDALVKIPHLRRLRVHSRLPIVIPERVSDELVALLRGTRLTPVMVIHANHPRELDENVAQAIATFVDGGVPTLNQAVLLRGVNDQVETLVDLSLRLVDLRVVPYYLNQLDRVQGAAHFEVPPERGRALMKQARDRLPGYAVPRYVQDVSGDCAKRGIE